MRALLRASQRDPDPRRRAFAGAAMNALLLPGLMQGLKSTAEGCLTSTPAARA